MQTRKWIFVFMCHSDGEMETELLLVDAHMKPGVWSLSMQDQAM